MSCPHLTTRDVSVAPFSGSVVFDSAYRSSAADGGICVRVQCVACGAERAQNRNGLHVETGPWGPSTSTRHARARAAIDRASRLTILLVPHVDGSARKVYSRVMPTSDPSRVTVLLDGVARRYALDEIRPPAGLGAPVIAAWQDIRARAELIVKSRFELERR